MLLKRRMPVSIILFLLLSISTFATALTTETEPNDSFLEPEIITVGSYNGSVSSFSSDDTDYFMISVPSGKDLKVTVTMISESGIIEVSSYDQNMELMIPTGIQLTIDTTGWPETDSWYNSHGYDCDVYLKFSGEGDYRMTVSITDSTREALKTFSIICLVGVIGTVLFVALVIGLIIFLIIFFRKKEKRDREMAGGVEITTDILRSEVVEVPPEADTRTGPSQRHDLPIKGIQKSNTVSGITPIPDESQTTPSSVPTTEYGTGRKVSETMQPSTPGASPSQHPSQITLEKK